MEEQKATSNDESVENKQCFLEALMKHGLDKCDKIQQQIH